MRNGDCRGWITKEYMKKPCRNLLVTLLIYLMIGNLLHPMYFGRLDQVGHGFGYQKVTCLFAYSLSLFFHMDDGFDSYFLFMQRTVVSEYPLNKDSLSILNLS